MDLGPPVVVLKADERDTQGVAAVIHPDALHAQPVPVAQQPAQHQSVQSQHQASAPQPTVHAAPQHVQPQPSAPVQVQPIQQHTAVSPSHTTATDMPSTAIPSTAPDHDSSLKNPEIAYGSAGQGAPTSTIDPNIPSSQSRPTALPTNAETHPNEQKDAIRDEHPHVIKREVEKTKAEEREVKGERPQGTVIRGLEDDRLWAMLRRFDVQVTHVLHPASKLPPAEPDLRQSALPNLPSHSETLKRNLERAIAAIGPSSVRGMREAQRLMSWTPQERHRTSMYCAAYFTAWIFGYAIVSVLVFAAALVCFPDCRRWLFPPIAPPPFTPPSATDPTNQKGDESLLGGTDSKTVHRSKAEQAEEQAFEAASLVQAYAARLIFDGRKRGKHAGNANVGEKEVDSSSSSSSSDEDDLLAPRLRDQHATLIDLDGNVTGKSQGQDSADVVVGGEKINADKELSEKEKKKLAAEMAKKKRDELVGKMTKATEDGLGAFADFMERMQNALSPPLPYPDSLARFKIAGAFLIPPMLLFHFVPAWIFGRAATFGFGFGFFGQPLIKKGIKKFMKAVPNWKDYLDMRNSILSRVPTDAQLTLHLLRVAEALQNPLPRPPPPPLAGTPKEAIKDTAPPALTEDDEDALSEAEHEGGVTHIATKAKVKTKSTVVGAFKGLGKKMAGFRGDVSVDGHKKKIGNKIDRLIFQGHVKDDGSIIKYPARFEGESGHIILEPKNELLPAPQVSFVPASGKDVRFVWSVDDIVEIKKSHVTMARLALGWASGADVEGLGLTIRFKPVAQQLREAQGLEKEDGVTMHFTRVQRREQLFVRLVSMGVQRWETL